MAYPQGKLCAVTKKMERERAKMINTKHKNVKHKIKTNDKYKTQNTKVLCCYLFINKVMYLFTVFFSQIREQKFTLTQLKYKFELKVRIT